MRQKNHTKECWELLKIMVRSSSINLGGIGFFEHLNFLWYILKHF